MIPHARWRFHYTVSNSVSGRARVSSALLLIVAGLCLSGRSIGQLPPPGAHGSNSGRIDPRAMALLGRMADAYARLGEISLRTEYYSTITPLAPDGSPAIIPESDKRAGMTRERLIAGSRLDYRHPNLLFIERRELNSGGDGDQVVRVSDGKTFWTYRSDKRWYTKDDAPSRLRSFVHLGTFAIDSIDLMLMLGIKPFKEMESQVDSIQYAGVEMVRDVQSDTIAIRSDSPTMLTEVRLYVGRDNGLMRRMTIESSTIPARGSRVRGNDELDHVADRVLPSDPAPLPGAGGAAPEAIKSFVRCDTFFEEHPAFDARTFAFTIPKGALLQEPLDPTGKRAKRKLQGQISDILRRLGRNTTGDTVYP